jgi:hypothetical protein
MNELSQPQIVSHVCSEHGLQLQAPTTMSVQCRCGRKCEVDVDGWVATQVAQRPDEDIERLAAQAGVLPHRARAALEHRD